MTTSVTLHPGDNRRTLRRLIDQGVRVHSVVTDPPYGLVSVTKRFGKEGSAPAKHGTDGAFARASAGFMGKAWDGTGIERDPEFWRLIHDILLPGGFVFAFSGSRTGHWQACAMEMAGFIMHPMHGWVFGSGFPKAHNAAKHIDALMLHGSARTTDIRRMEMGDEYEPSGRGRTNFDNGGASKMNGAVGKYVPKTPEAQQWDGWRHGTQSQKPALEPVYLGQKPYSEKTGAANLLKHGVGAFNIDGCRVRSPGENTMRSRTTGDFGMINDDGWSPKAGQNGSTDGRWPANLLHDGSPDVVALFPAQAGAAAAAVKGSEPSEATDLVYGARDRVAGAFHNDDGSAARFFNNFAPTDEDYQWAAAAGLIDTPDIDPIIYQGKASKRDRAGSQHPTVKPIALMQHFIRHITPPGGIVLDPFAGSGTTAEAARREGFDCVLMEADPEYLAFLRERFDVPVDLKQLPRSIRELLGENDTIESLLA